MPLSKATKMQDDERGNLTVEERAAAILVVELIPGTDIMRETSGIQLSKSKRHHVYCHHLFYH